LLGVIAAYLPVSTKLTQSPWFLNCGKFRQPPSLYYSLLVGTHGTGLNAM
jgi:hypothetical protein